MSGKKYCVILDTPEVTVWYDRNGNTQFAPTDDCYFDSYEEAQKLVKKLGLQGADIEED